MSTSTRRKAISPQPDFDELTEREMEALERDEDAGDDEPEVKVETFSARELELLKLDEEAVQGLDPDETRMLERARHKKRLKGRTSKKQLEQHAEMEAERLRQTARARQLGRKPSKRRRDALRLCLRQQILDTEEPKEEEELDQLVEQEMKRCLELYEGLQREAEQYEPLLALFDADLPERDVRFRAVMGHPLMRFLRALLEWLASPQGHGGGRPSWNPRLPSSMLIWLAAAGDPPVIGRAYESCKANARRAWAMCHPGPGPGSDSVRRGIQRMLERLQHTHADVLDDMLITAASDLAMKCRDPQHVKSGKLRAVCDDPFDVLVADAQVIVANQPQRKAPNRAIEALWQHHGRWKHTAFLVYAATRSFLQPTWSASYNPDQKQVLNDEPRARTMRAIVSKGRAWKLFTIAASRPGIALAVRTDKATYDERVAYIEMLEDLLEHRAPWLRPSWLVIDSLADDWAFKAAVRERWGIVVVTPKGKEPSKKWRFTDPHDKLFPGRWGVPICTCGDLMIVKSRSGFGVNADGGRQRMGQKELGRDIRNGEILAANTPGRIRWKCVNGKKHTETTYAADNERLYTYLPRVSLRDLEAQRQAKIRSKGKEAGTAVPGRAYADHWAAKHLALLGCREFAETLFSIVERDHLKGVGSGRAKWAGDREMRYLLQIHELSRTVLKLAWLDGSLELFDEECQRLELDDIPLFEGPEPKALEAALRSHSTEPMRRPQGFAAEPALERHLREWSEMPDDELVQRVRGRRTEECERRQRVANAGRERRAAESRRRRPH